MHLCPFEIPLCGLSQLSRHLHFLESGNDLGDADAHMFLFVNAATACPDSCLMSLVIIDLLLRGLLGVGCFKCDVSSGVG